MRPIPVVLIDSLHGNLTFPHAHDAISLQRLRPLLPESLQELTHLEGSMAYPKASVNFDT